MERLSRGAGARVGAGPTLKEEAVLRAGWVGSAGGRAVFSGLGGKSDHLPLLGDELPSVAAPCSSHGGWRA